MKYLKIYTLFDRVSKETKLFENLVSKIDFEELVGLLIDFKQMGLDYDIKAGSSSVIDWRLFNDDKQGGPKVLRSNEIDKYRKSFTSDSLTIEFDSTDRHTYNLTETIEAYEMLKDYLFDNYNLIPNYIYINYNWGYMYFEDFDKIKELSVTDVMDWNHWQFAYEKLPLRSENTFKADKLTFGFYK